MQFQLRMVLPKPVNECEENAGLNCGCYVYIIFVQVVARSMVVAAAMVVVAMEVATAMEVGGLSLF